MAPRRRSRTGSPEPAAGGTGSGDGSGAATFAVESELWGRGLSRLAGIDEVGRGPLAGPVVAAAVILPKGLVLEGVDDSKRLDAPSREALARVIRRKAVAIGLGAASAREIDRINILAATHLAMRRALARVEPSPEHVIVDGLPVPTLGTDHTAVVAGDRLVHCVACASIVAKVVRDRLMRQLAARYPGYGWEHNAGYATLEHREALERLGPTPHHRRSFMSLQLSFDLDD